MPARGHVQCPARTTPTVGTFLHKALYIYKMPRGKRGRCRALRLGAMLLQDLVGSVVEQRNDVSVVIRPNDLFPLGEPRRDGLRHRLIGDELRVFR